MQPEAQIITDPVEVNDEPTGAGGQSSEPDATWSWDDLKDLSTPDLIAWAEAHPAEWAALKQPAVTSPAVEEGEGEIDYAALASGDEPTDEAALRRVLAQHSDDFDPQQIADLRAALDGTAGSAPPGHPLRTAQLREAAGLALYLEARLPERPFVSNMTRTRFDAVRGGYVVEAVDDLNPLRVEELGFATREELDADPEPDPASSKPTLEETRSMSTEELLSLRESDPDHFASLLRAESDARDEIAIRARNGIV